MKFSGFNTTEKVGIGFAGTSLPNQTLVVKASLPVIALESSNSQGRIDFRDGSTVQATIGLNPTHGDSFNIALGGSLTSDVKLLVKPDGNVGIGTTAPATPLHVYSTANDVLKIQGGDHVRVLIDGTDSSEKSLNFSEAGSLMWKLGMENIAPFEAFVIKNNDNGAPQFVIDYSTGYVGIGVDPDGIGFRAEQSINGNWAGLIKNTHATNGHGLKVQAGDDSAVTSFRVANVSNTTLLEVLGDGKVGIGTNSPDNPLEVNSGASDAGIKLSNSAGTDLGWIHQQGTEAGAFRLYDAGNLKVIIHADNGLNSYINNGGNVGIGTAAPTSKLCVGGVSTQTTNLPTIIAYDETNGASLQLRGGSPRIFMDCMAGGVGKVLMDGQGVEFKDGTLDSEGNVDVKIASDGKVGIGTSAPTSKLHVKLDSSSSGDANLRIQSAVYPSIEFYSDNANTNNRNWKISSVYNSYGTFEILSSTAAGGVPTTSRLAINKDGKVGIGNASPYFPLHVQGPTGFNGEAKNNALLFDTASATTGTGGGLAFGGYSNGTGGDTYHFGNIQGIKENSTAGNYASAMLFSTRANGATPLEQMRITSAGKVIINDTVTTNNNNAQLYVNGPVYSSEFDLPSGGVLDWGNGDARIQEGLTTNYSLSFRNYDGSSAMVTTMFLKNDGRVGIGTNAPSSRLHINGGTASQATGLTFGDGDTGFYEHSDDSMWYFSAGVNRWKSDSSYLFSTTTTSKATIINEVASATNPVFTFYNDLDTGLGQVAANQLSLIAGGVKAAVVTSTGFGIRTTPASGVILDVRDSGDANTKQYLINTGQTTAGRETEFIFGKDNGANLTGTLKYYYHTTQASRRIDLLHYGTNAGLTILNNGRIGLNTTSPGAMLELIGGTINGATQYPGISGKHGSTQLYRLEQWFGDEGYLALYLAGTKTIQFRGGNTTSGAAHSYINTGSSNNFGVGTSSPSAKLFVMGDSTARAFQAVSSSAGNGTGYFYTNMVHTGTDTSATVSIRSDHASSSGQVLHVRGDGSGDLLTLDQGGTSRVVVKAGGSVGIGTTAPGFRFEVRESSATWLSRIYNTGTGNGLLVRVDSGSSDAILSTHNGTNHILVVKGDEKVGIGTYSPSNLLSVEGAIAGDYLAEFKQSHAVAGASYGVNICGGTNASDQAFRVANEAESTLMQVCGDGEIRVAGQTLVDSVNTNYKMTFPDNSGIAMGSAYTFANIYGNAGNIYLRANAYPANTGSTSKIYFVTANSSGGQAGDVVVNNGQLGIGTAAPNQLLHLEKGDTNTNELATGTGPQIKLRNTSDTNGNIASIDFYNSTGYITGRIGAKFVDAGDRNTDLYFATRANSGSLTTQMRIKSDGNVGIGTTAPQAKTDIVEVYTDSVSAVEGLQLLIRGGQADLSPTGDSIGLGFGYGSANNYVKTGIINEFTSANGTSSLHLCTTATAGVATITKADARLTVKSDGNVGIGTTNPGQLLEVGNDGDSDYALIGPTKIGGGMGHGDYAGFSHRSCGGPSNYCLLQYNNGSTYLNAASGQSVYLRINNSSVLTLTATTATFSGDVKAAQFYTGYDWTSRSGGINIGNQGVTTGAISFYDGVLASSASIYRDSSSVFFVGARGGTNTAGIAIATDGKVGIGTTAPLSKFNVKGTQGNWRVDPDSVSSEIQVLSTTVANDGFRSFRLRTNETIFDTGGSERMRITSAGKVFIGDTTASNAQLRVKQSTSGEWAANIINHQSVAYGLSIDTSSAASTDAYNFAAYTPAGTGFFLKNTGNVGIGTAAPDTQLHLHYASPSPTMASITRANLDDLGILVEDSSLDNNNGEITCGIAFGYQGESSTAIAAVDEGGSGASGLGFVTGTSSSVAERLRITNNGSVGIGTAAPDQKLSVTGNIQARSGYWFIARSADNAGYSYLKNPSTSGSEIAFHTSGEKMRLLSNGNVGIGTTTPASKLHVNGTIISNGNIQLTQTGISYCYISSLQGPNPGFLGGSAFFKAKAHNTAGTTQLAETWFTQDSGGVFSIAHSTSGTPTARISVKTDGNVGIGIVAPAEKLDVNGTVKASNLHIDHGRGEQRLSGSTTCNDNTWTEIAYVSHSFMARANFWAYQAPDKNGGALYDFGVSYGSAAETRTFHKTSTEILSVEAQYLNTGGSTSYVIRVRVNLNSAASCTVFWTLDGNANATWYKI